MIDPSTTPPGDGVVRVNVDGRRVCGAQLRKQPGKYCQRPPMVGKARCRLHGGRSRPGGYKSERLSTGRYSKHLPKQIRALYHQATADEEYLSLREDIALYSTRVAVLLGQLETGDCGELWRRLKRHHDAMRAAVAAGDQAAFQAAFQAQGELVEKGLAHDFLWREVFDALRHKREASRAEFARLESLQQLVTIEQYFRAMAKIGAVIAANVTDPAAQARIAEQIERLADGEVIGVARGNGLPVRLPDAGAGDPRAD